MTTFPPSPAQGETAGVSEQRLKELAYVDDTRPTTAELLAVIDNLIDNHAHYATSYDYIYQAYRVKLVAIRQIVGGDEVARQQLAAREAECRVKERALTSFSRQLAEMRGKLEPHSKWLHLAAARLQKQQRDYSIANTCEEAADAIDAALAPTSQPSRGKCAECAEGNYPYYGVAPHTCFFKIPGAIPGQSKLLPRDQWPSNFTEDPDAPGCGTYSCPDCAQPERQGDEDGADTGNAEADRVLRRLASSDPEFDDCTAAAVLIRRLVADMRGPDGFATWKDAAIAERLKRTSPPPTDDIVAGLRLVSNELGAQRRYALRKRVDRAIAALKGEDK